VYRVKVSFRWAIVVLKFSGAACAATLTVGPTQQFKLPSEAIAAAAPGDTIRIAPGTYRDCAAWSKDNLTIEGTGNGTVITEEICQGAGIFVVNAPNATLRNITFTNAVIDEGNGSGVRANGLNLIIDTCTFRDNQDGILTANKPTGTLTIRNSIFERNGACLPNKGCAHGIYAGNLALVRIENSRFFNARVGHHIKSRARRTEVVGNTIEDGPNGTSSYLVDLPNGGSLLMTGNTLEKGPNTQNRTAAITIGEEGGNRPPAEVVISGNKFRNDGPHTLFVRNKTKSVVQLSGNILTGPAKALSGPGTTD
jgi:hypothetical protein